MKNVKELRAGSMGWAPDQAHPDDRQSTLNSNVTATVTTGAAPSPASADVVPVAYGARNPQVQNAGGGLARELPKTFVADCCRNLEGLMSDEDFQEVWRLDEQALAQLAGDKTVWGEIKAEQERRVRSGEAAREAAQQHYAKAPSILNDILKNETMSPRYRIEAAKELRQVAGTDREKTSPSEKFTIVIDLGGDDRFIEEINLPARSPSDDGDAQ